MKTYLRVPFSEHDEARRLGARWNNARKLWYVEDVENIAAFIKWFRPEHLAPHKPNKVPKKRHRQPRH
uniref:DUF5710 domain-containing protein n=1 Tax=Candidatus Nitrotoga fabula TaxID=2182327 RepID=A0A2X0SIR3_9PROT|nr:conserved protein of unknown function [Candidatus Nitrotoga fabula]